jgi:pimeloyl-ACP methyl ester carboxylesterase
LSGPRSGALSWNHRGRRFPIAYLHSAGREGTILYLHGLGGSAEDFLGAWQVPEWRGCTLVAFDAPGCGATRAYSSGLPLGVDDVVAAAEAVSESLCLRDLTVVGHSMGGLAGLLFVLRNPGSVRRFASVEGNLGPEDCSVFSRRVYQQRFLGREPEFMEDLAREFRNAGAAGFAEFAASFRQRVQDAAFFDYCRSVVDYSDHFPLLEEFLALERPRLYVHGSENAHLSHIPRLLRHGVPVCSVPDSNHFPAASNPGFYYRALARFTDGPDV